MAPILHYKPVLLLFLWDEAIPPRSISASFPTVDDETFGCAIVTDLPSRLLHAIFRSL